MTKQENRVRLAPLVDQHLDYYIHERNALSVEGEDSGTRTTKHDLITDLVMDFLTKKGHWPPKWAKEGEAIDVSKRVEDGV